MPGILAVETPFRNFDLAGTGRLELKEREREIEAQRQTRDELLLPPILIEVRFLHGAQRRRQTFAGQQAFMQPIPNVQRQVALRRQLALQLECPLRLPRPAPCDIEHLSVQRRRSPAAETDRAQ